MEFGFWNAIEIIGSLAFFIYGMKLMSEGIQRAAGAQMRNILSAMTRNRYLGVFTGFLITALVQSSSATTVMTVSFVNAGLLSLVESAGVMMGANIGTTITGWIISILGFKVKLSQYSIPLFAIGLPMLFAVRGKLKHWGEFIIGFAILFMGLSLLKGAVPDLKGNPEALSWLSGFTEWGIFSRLFFVFVGALVTIIVQSSSAAMAITLTMCAQGWLPFEVAAAMILGENIGTTITAELASLVGNTNAKRSARIHSMFNIIGVTWMVILLPFLLPILGNFIEFIGQPNPYTSEGMPVGLSAFHTAFNLTNVLILLAFVPFLVKAAIWSVPSKEGEEDDEGLKFISTAIKTPELATIEVQKEVVRFGQVTKKMSEFAVTLMNAPKEKKKRKMLKKLSKYEKITDDFELQITEYVTRLANQEMTKRTSNSLRSYLNICNDLERIGDLYFQLSKILERKLDEKIYFIPEQRDELNYLFTLIERAFEIMVDNISKPHYDKVDILEAISCEKEINAQRDKMKSQNLTSLGTEDYNVQSAMVYNTMFSILEKIGDHIVSVSEDIAGNYDRNELEKVESEAVAS